MFFISLFIASIGFGFLNRWLLLKVNDRLWKRKILKTAARFLPYMSLFFALFWGLGNLTNIDLIKTFGAAATSISLVLNALLLISLPFSFWLDLLAMKKKKLKRTVTNGSRRQFLKTATASFPLLAMGGTASGLASSFSPTRFPKIEVTYANLPQALDGFKILHLSDLHLGNYFNLQDLENTLLDAEKYKADMVVVTGDIADDIDQLTDATRLIGQLKTPYEKFISVGNHEYYRGIQRSIEHIEHGPVPLLYNTHQHMNVKGVKVLVGGVDDPVHMRKEIIGFLDKSINKTFKNAADSDFKLLMSHRPRALDLAPKYHIDLTLSGHTHGGQIGLGGRSFWEIFNENGYLWGLYKRENSRLYTSAGMGHWFPFRLNCPLEAPLIILKKSPSLPA